MFYKHLKIGHKDFIFCITFKCQHEFETEEKLADSPYGKHVMLERICIYCGTHDDMYLSNCDKLGHSHSKWCF